MTDKYFADNYLDFCLFTIAAMDADFIDFNIDWIYAEGGEEIYPVQKYGKEKITVTLL